VGQSLAGAMLAPAPGQSDRSVAEAAAAPVQEQEPPNGRMPRPQARGYNLGALPWICWTIPLAEPSTQSSAPYMDGRRGPGGRTCSGTRGRPYRWLPRSNLRTFHQRWRAARRGACSLRRVGRARAYRRRRRGTQAHRSTHYWASCSQSARRRAHAWGRRGARRRRGVHASLSPPHPTRARARSRPLPLSLALSSGVAGRQSS